MNNLELMSDANKLFDAFNKAKQGSSWKASTQRCEMNLLRNIYALRESLRNGSYKQKPFCEFIQSERGKVRPIRSQYITDRIVQRSLCDNVLIPTLRPYLTYDNGASMKNKGLDFARRRAKAHIQKFLRHHDDGYVLQIDFSKFFDNIEHEKLLRSIEPRFGGDTSVMPLLTHVVTAFSPDVSYMTDDEYAASGKEPFNTLVNRQRLASYDGEKRTKFLDKSVGIGSQVSQISGVYFPSRIDTFFKVVKGFKYYGRYMDDVYIISESRSKLAQALGDFIEQANALGMFVNRKKTHIVKLTHGFTYLKTRFIVVGKRVVDRADNSAFVRERRRLKRYRGLVENGVMTRKMVSDAYQSWRGTVVRHYNRKQNLRYTDKLYSELFVDN